MINRKDENVCLSIIKPVGLNISKIDKTYIAFLLLESLYASQDINLKTYQNVLKKKSGYEQKLASGG